jgi:cyclic beta-1,2-glucan synthetase
VAVALVNWLVCRLLPPRVLPKLDFTAGIPADCRTVVVVPGMLLRPDSAAVLCERLELHYLANPDPQLRFALLTDWADAPAETAPEDDALVKAAVAAGRTSSSSSTASGCSTRPRARGWGGSGSAANSTSSTASSAARPTPATS